MSCEKTACEPTFVDKLRDQDPEASRQLIEFSRRLHLLALQKLAPIGLRRSCVADDVVASVYKSFVRRANQDVEPLHFENDDRLFSWLAQATVYKCCEAMRRERRRIASLPTGEWSELVDAFNSVNEVEFNETIDQLLAGFSPEKKEIARRLILDYSLIEISRELGHVVYTITKVRDELRLRLQRMTQRPFVAETV